MKATKLQDLSPSSLSSTVSTNPTSPTPLFASGANLESDMLVPFTTPVPMLEFDSATNNLLHLRYYVASGLLEVSYNCFCALWNISNNGKRNLFPNLES